MELKTMWKSFIVNFMLAVLKAIVSFLANSKTLLADAVHSISDMSTDIIALIGAKIASKKPDKFHPYGHGKMEYVTSIFISIFVVILGIVIFRNSFSTNRIIYSYYIFLIMPITIILKYLLSSYLIENGKKLNSNILLTSGTESRFNMINTTFAFTIVIVSYFQKYIGILKYADMIGSIVISLFTIRIGLKMFFENTRSVIGEIDTNPEKNNAIRELLLKNKKIKSIERIILLKYGSYTILTVEITMDSSLKLNSIYKVEKSIKKETKKTYSDIKYVTVNIKPSKIID